ncbi:hypothetical protein [Pseudomonas koreensis]|uniref:hypothetical protein n=1 Tax=Pseudomonas koreensis TaxID=198620 RepID=UPI0020777067|nr:hypothetical protein [Pseudomonas koreensis]MCM8742331.1 hypothetical protein [Pseudomonas koreensis]
MTDRGIYLDEYLDTIRQAIEAGLGCKTELFAGQFTEEDLKNIKIPAGDIFVLVTGAGGPLRKGLKLGEVESTIGAGALVIAKTDGHGNGFSRAAAHATQKLLGILQDTKIAAAKAPKSIEFLEWGEETSGFKTGSAYSVWSLIWQQTLILKTN